MFARFTRLVGVGALLIATAAIAAGAPTATATTSETASQAVAAKPGPKVRTALVEITTSRTGKVTTKIDGVVQPAPRRIYGPTYSSLPYYTSVRFASKNICVWDVQNSSAYDVAWEANTFEAGTATVMTTYRTSAQGCAGIVPSKSQVMRVLQYSTNDGNCSSAKGYMTYVDYPENPHYTRVWNATDYPTAYVNVWGPANDICKATATNRQHALGAGMGQTFGLGAFYDTTTMAVLNTYMYDTTAGAWAHDRNRLNLLMNPS